MDARRPYFSVEEAIAAGRERRETSPAPAATAGLTRARFGRITGRGRFSVEGRTC